MFARHPKTGAPIRIIKAEGTIWRDTKTLVWLEDSVPKGCHRWDTGTSSIEAWHQVSPKVPVDICILNGDIGKAIQWLEAGHWSECKLIAIPKAVIETLGLQRLRRLEITNSVCLEEAIDLYPYLELPWDGTEQDSRALIALLLQYKASFPVIETSHTKQAKLLGLTLSPTLKTPAPLIYITQYFVHPKVKRSREINYCLKKNVDCQYIDRIVLLNEKDHYLGDFTFNTDKIEQVNIGERIRFDHVLKWIYEKAPADAIIVIANSDIYLDDTWRIIWSTAMENKFISLLRWDDSEDPREPPKLFGPRADSQDTWAVAASSIKSRKWDWESVKIPFGKGGCDNAINVEMLKQRFLVVNPCMSLYTHHVHTSGIRNYDPSDIIDKPVLMYLNPTGIHDLRPDIQISVAPKMTITDEATPLRLEGPLKDSQLQTFVTMVGKTWPSIAERAEIPTTKIPIYEFDNVSQTHEGLLHTYNSIIVGNSKTAADAWAKSEISAVSAHIDIPVALVAYCPDQVLASSARYMLQYLGKILVLNDLVPGEWMASKKGGSVEALKLFVWPGETIPVIERVPGYQVWCRKAYAWLPQDGFAAMPTRAEISALRKGLLYWNAEPADKKRIVCILDPVYVTTEFANRLEELVGHSIEISYIYETTSLASRVALLRGAMGVVVQGMRAGFDQWGLLWTLPVGAKVWDIQGEMEPTIEVVQLCEVANLKHSLHIVPRNAPMGSYLKPIVESCLQTKKTKPVIYMPKAQGFFAHAGDSFRETVEIWAERGYVEIDRTKNVSQVWLGGVGETLLYDRPTLEWLHRAPPQERTWKKGLFGNPVPPPGGSAWSFWPRRPRFVEELVAQGVPNASWEEREKMIVFYGRSENAVQKARRSTADWAPICSEFVHLEGLETYKFTEMEYLKRLATARWGLCLAGYGKKCHREIECMAMGCVPIVHTEVDMDSYAEPLKEGVHYFRVAGPEDIPRILDSKDVWEKMSAAVKEWFKRNASVDAIWRLTSTV